MKGKTYWLNAWKYHNCETRIAPCLHLEGGNCNQCVGNYEIGWRNDYT